MRKISLWLVGLLLMTTGCSPVVTIQPNEVGVIFNIFTDDIGDPLMPGTYFVNPIADVITIYRTSQQQLTLADRSAATLPTMLSPSASLITRMVGLMRRYSTRLTPQWSIS